MSSVDPRDSARFVCVHGHFYQPPRENPWLEEIEIQDSAYPYHDWNERITAECYAPNAESRILDERDWIVDITNNYSRISFNFGPTLLSWLESKSPEVYRAILEADRDSRARFSGHGAAIAQAYNHVILPLASSRDKRTQVLWGIRDFEARFGRLPEGMWLPETAVDVESLEILAEQGIRYTILSPTQAARWRLPGGAWTESVGGDVDTSIPYLARLPSGRSISIFFYERSIAQQVAFERLLANGEQFARRLLGGGAGGAGSHGLVNIATDGETYGHHHRHGDMALAYALRMIESGGSARLTVYGEHLDRFPPVVEVEVRESTSWSCAHGVERWRSDCGCSSGEGRGWRQAWRGPLRQALDDLRDAVARPFEDAAGRLLRDPWAARDEYVRVVLDRSPGNVTGFLAAHAIGPLGPAERTAALKLLELQRNAMLMYTSCGWFFDEISRIETVQVLAYAGRVIQLAEELFGGAFEEPFLKALSRAPSNLAEYRDGRGVYEKFVRPAKVDLPKVGAHYAISSLFEGYGPRARVYCYDVEREDARVLSADRLKLAVGKARITSEITGESARLTFGVLHFGDHNITGGVREFRGEKEDEELLEAVTASFSRADVPGLIRQLDLGFGKNIYSLKLLFRDEQRKILGLILDTTVEGAEEVLLQIHDRHLPLMRFLTDLGTPLPAVFRTTAEFSVNSTLRRALGSDRLDFDRIGALLREAEAEKLRLDAATLEFAFRKRIERLARQLRAEPERDDLLQMLEGAVDLARILPFPVDLWEAQKVYFALRRSIPAAVAAGHPADEAAVVRVGRLRALGEKLSIRV